MSTAEVRISHKMAVDVRSFPTKALLSAQLGAAVAEVFAKHPPSRPFTVAISGGSLPKLLAAGLSEDSGIDFARWVVFFADERLVPLDHGDSNFKACDEALFQPLGIPRANVHTADSGLQGREVGRNPAARGGWGPIRLRRLQRRMPRCCTRWWGGMQPTRPRSTLCCLAWVSGTAAAARRRRR